MARLMRVCPGATSAPGQHSLKVGSPEGLFHHQRVNEIAIRAPFSARLPSAMGEPPHILLAV